MSRSLLSTLHFCSKPARDSIVHSSCWQPTPMGLACVRPPRPFGRPFSQVRALRTLWPSTLPCSRRSTWRSFELARCQERLNNILQVLSSDRSRAEALQRKVTDALRYPAFLLFAAMCVLVFFLMFVLPQFGSVLHDFGAKIDPVVGTFLQLSEFMNEQKDMIAAAIATMLAAALLSARQAKLRAAFIFRAVRLPLVRQVVVLQQTSVFCRNLAVLLSAGVPLTASLRILADMMSSLGNGAIWTRIVERVRQGGKVV